MEEQFLTLINIATEEYDKFIEKQNEYLLEKVKTGAGHENGSFSSRLDSRASDKKSFISPHERSVLNKKV